MEDTEIDLVRRTEMAEGGKNMRGTGNFTPVLIKKEGARRQFPRQSGIGGKYNP